MKFKKTAPTVCLELQAYIAFHVCLCMCMCFVYVSTYITTILTNSVIALTFVTFCLIYLCQPQCLSYSH